MKLKDVTIRFPNHRLSFIHNPKHFIGNSFIVGKDNKNRLALFGKPRPHSKPFKIVAVMKEKRN